MTHGTKSQLRSRLRYLPEPVSRSKHFLLWRHEWNERRQVFVKAPYYTAGNKRHGALDTPKDLRNLTSLQSALDAYEAGEYDGIGLALVGDGIAAFDIDKCLTPDGELIPDHAGRYLAERAEAEGAYIEISPSGKGLRVLGTSDDPSAYSLKGLEYWGEGRYVTLTGSLWANPKGWRDLSDLRATLPTRELKKRDEEDEDSLVTNRVIDELRSALSSMSSDERDLWIRMGHALKTVGDRGKTLWMDWSAKSHKFNEDDAEATWDSFRPAHTGYRAIFAEAQENWDWDNPRSGKAEAQDDPSSLLDFSIDLGDNLLQPTEFVLDGFLPVGVSLVAGAWGAGKSTNLIPLFASVAHLTPNSWGFHPVLRRHIIWITEAPDQARDTIYSLTQAEDSADWPDYKKWFHLIPSRRTKPKTLAKSIKEAVAELTYTLDNGFAIRPVVVLDTVSANLDLTNESDNSEVGAAMNQLKESLPGVPLVLIGHTPKASKDNLELTFRGAGAWEADAVATYFLVYDPETSFRYMALGKVRFTPDYNEISFGQEGGRELVETQWGEPQSKAYMHGIPQKSTGDERRSAQQKVKEDKKETARQDDITQRKSRIMEAVTKTTDDAVLMTKTRLKDLIGGNQTTFNEAYKALLDGDMLYEPSIPDQLKSQMKGRIPETVILPTEVDGQEFFERVLYALL